VAAAMSDEPASGDWSGVMATSSAQRAQSLDNKGAEVVGALAAAPAPAPFTMLPACQAGVVLADPPWSFITYSPKGWRKSAHAHYPCMDIDDILAIPVAELVAPDSVLVLWSTQVHLIHALAVLEAWGFGFKNAAAWAKQSRSGQRWQFGTGYLLRSAAEFFLIGTRGRPPQLSRRSRNLIVAPVREHSRKPDQIYELIESTWPGPYVELFARYARAGWTQWPAPLAEAGP
jgi:N6-adenosine-specific RNA methylase IME4